MSEFNLCVYARGSEACPNFARDDYNCVHGGGKYCSTFREREAATLHHYKIAVEAQ